MKTGNYYRSLGFVNQGKTVYDCFKVRHLNIISYKSWKLSELRLINQYLDDWTDGQFNLVTSRKRDNIILQYLKTRIFYTFKSEIADVFLYRFL